MALHLRKQMPYSAKLIVCDINQDRIDTFLVEAQSLGLVEVAYSPREIAEKSEIIITSLPPEKPFFKVFVDDPSTSILAAGISDRSRLIIDTSTVDVRSSLRVAKQITSAGFGDFIDCPVSGGMIYADKGELSAMVGSSRELFNKIYPILLTFAAEKSIYHCGPSGSGLAAKIINNYIASISYVALCEGMNTGVRFGLDPRILTGKWFNCLNYLTDIDRRNQCKQRNELELSPYVPSQGNPGHIIVKSGFSRGPRWWSRFRFRGREYGDDDSVDGTSWC